MSLKMDVWELLDKSIADTKNHIRNMSKCRLGDLKFLDLLVCPKREGEKNGMRHGVYLFFDDKDTCVYVGKCASLHFAERLSEHFRMSPHNNPNGFLGKIVHELHGKDSDGKERKVTYSDYVDTVNNSALAEYRYLMIAVNPNLKGDLYQDETEKKYLVDMLEKVFIGMFDPKHNQRGKNLKSAVEKSGDKNLKEFVRCQFNKKRAAQKHK